MSDTELSRRELYDEVWSTPMVKLSRKYGLSDVGMAKICKKHDIPRPPRGYWAKKRHGKRTRQTPLPNPESNDAISLRDPDDVQVQSPKLRKKVEDMVAKEAAEEQKVLVADSLHGSHRLIAAANAELQRAETDDLGMIDPSGTGLNVQVSKKNLRRALLILDAVLKALEGRGHTVTRGPTAKILGVEVCFGLSEQISTIKEEPEAPDLDGRYVFSHSRFNQKRVPSGKLTIQINEGGTYYNDWSKGCRKTWRDAKKQRIEDRLNAFVAGLIEVAARKQEHEKEQARIAEERQKEKEREEAERKRRAAIHDKAKRERARVDDLFIRAEAWQLSERLRAYIGAETEKHIAKHGEVIPQSEFAEWREWALHQADRQDPLKENPSSILDEDDGRDEEPRKRSRW